MTRHETGGNVVMNFAIRNEGRRAYLCAGQESHCQMYIVNHRVLNGDGAEVINGASNCDKHPGQENGLRSRLNRNLDPADDSLNTDNRPNGHVDLDKLDEHKTNGKTPDDDLKRILKFDVKSADSIQTDFLESEPLQRVVRISANGSLMATGGTDGYLRIWSFPQMLQTIELK